MQANFCAALLEQYWSVTGTRVWEDLRTNIKKERIRRFSNEEEQSEVPISCVVDRWARKVPLLYPG